MAERASIPGGEGEVARSASELIARGSIEMPAHRAGDAQTIAGLLPAGTAVYVPHLPRDTTEDTLGALRAVKAAGLEPVPHLAARRIRLETQLSPARRGSNNRRAQGTADRWR